MNIPEELIPVIDWWQKDGKKTLLLLICAGLVAIGIYFWIAKQNRLDCEASAFAYGNRDYSVEELKSAAEMYGDREVAGMIKLRLAAKYMADNDFGNALDVYTGLIDDKTVPAAFALVPEFAAARCNESLGKWTEAKKIYDAVIADGKASSADAFNARLGAARCLAFSGKRAEAVKDLETLKASCSADKVATLVVDGNIDAVKRWEPREKPLPAPLPAPAEIKVPEVKASELTLPSAAPKAPVTEKPAPAPAAAK